MENNPPPIPPGIVVGISTFVLAWSGTNVMGGNFSLTRPTVATLAWGAVGFLIGLAVFLDDKRIQQRSTKQSQAEAAGPDMETKHSDGDRPTTERIAVFVLALPAIACFVLWQHQALGLSRLACNGLTLFVMIATAVLGYIDGRTLKIRDPDRRIGKAPFQPVACFGAMLGLWFIGYPAFFVARWRMGAMNLIVPAIIVAIAFVVASVAVVFS